MEFIAFDVETSGLSPDRDRIVELAALRFRLDDHGEPEPVDEFEALVDPGPGVILSASNTAIHGITNEMLRGAADAPTVLAAFQRWLGPYWPRMLAHNIRFDLSFLAATCRRHHIDLGPWLVFDTLPAARQAWPQESTHKLSILTPRVVKIATDFKMAHSAMGDCQRCRFLWQALHEKAVRPTVHVVPSLAQL